jgi:hypothetical protein
MKANIGQTEVKKMTQEGLGRYQQRIAEIEARILALKDLLKEAREDGGLNQINCINVDIIEFNNKVDQLIKELNELKGTVIEIMKTSTKRIIPDETLVSFNLLVDGKVESYLQLLITSGIVNGLENEISAYSPVGRTLLSKPISRLMKKPIPVIGVPNMMIILVEAVKKPVEVKPSVESEKPKDPVITKLPLNQKED